MAVCQAVARAGPAAGGRGNVKPCTGQAPVARRAPPPAAAGRRLRAALGTVATTEAALPDLETVRNREPQAWMVRVLAGLPGAAAAALGN